MKQTLFLTALLLIVAQNVYSQQKPLSALITKDAYKSELIEHDMSLTPASDSKKSVFLAVVASLAVPGLGELYAGSFETGKYHLIAEGGLWLAYSGVRSHSNRLLDDAKTFGAIHSGADFNNKDDEYLVNVGNYNSIEEFNDARSRGRYYLDVYQPSQAGYEWNWDNEANRLKFKDLRIKSSETKRNSKFIVGAIVVNHILSAFSAGKKTAAYNRSLSAIESIEINSYTMNNGSAVDGLGIDITVHF